MPEVVKENIRNVTIRAYTAKDYEDCCQLFDSNTPQFFANSERADFEIFLKNYTQENYWVATKDNQIIACGGIRIKGNGIGGLSYGMVRQDLHNSGIGRKLTEFRLNKLLENPDISTVELETSQHTYRFFEKLGFSTKEIRKNFYEQGLDCYNMELKKEFHPLNTSTSHPAPN